MSCGDFFALVVEKTSSAVYWTVTFAFLLTGVGVLANVGAFVDTRAAAQIGTVLAAVGCLLAAFGALVAGVLAALRWISHAYISRVLDSKLSLV